MTSEPAPFEESFEMNPHWITATIRVCSRPFAVLTPILLRALHLSLNLNLPVRGYAEFGFASYRPA